MNSNYSQPILYVIGFAAMMFSFLVSFFGCMCDETKFILNLIPMVMGVFLISFTYHHYKNCKVAQEKKQD